MNRIVIFEIEFEPKGSGKISKIVNYMITWAREWQEVAKREFKNYKPGSKKMIHVFNPENELIYGYKNY